MHFYHLDRATKLNTDQLVDVAQQMEFGWTGRLVMLEPPVQPTPGRRLRMPSWWGTDEENTEDNLRAMQQMSRG